MKKKKTNSTLIQDRIELWLADFLELDWNRDATVVYTCWTVFPTSVKKNILARLRECENLRWFVCQEPITWEQNVLKLVKKRKVRVSWSDMKANLYFYRKRRSRKASSTKKRM